MITYSDRNLSQKLERAEARANSDFVDTHVRLDPGCGATWIEVAGVYAMFDGAQSPLTQTFGLGVFDEITDAVMERLESFFRQFDAPVLHEVSPMADPSLMALLNKRGYQPLELTSVLYRGLGPGNLGKPSTNSRITTRIIRPDEVDLWAQVSARGWATEHESLADFMLSFGRVSARSNGAYPFLAELGGMPISTGMLFIYDDVAILAGASTVPEGRNNGAQNALLRSRLKFAAARGCTLATMGAAPGSQSQKNAQKNDFAIAYTRTKWQLTE